MTDDRHRTSSDQPDDTTPTDQTPVHDESTEDSPRNAVGAYLLDALPAEERSEFEEFLATSPDAQAEVEQLAPVVALLPKLLDTELAAQSADAPSPELRDRIVQAAKADATTSVPAVVPARARTIRTVPEATTGARGNRTQGRSRGGAAMSSRSDDRAGRVSTFRMPPAPWLAAAALAVVAIGAIIWALALQGRIDTKNREITAQSSEIAQLRSNANATAYTLSAGTDAGSQAGGTLLFSLRDQIGVLYVHTLPKLSADQVYQLWYLDDQREAPVPGATFTVDRNGNGVVTVSADTPSYDGIALTQEPEGGSSAPTSAILLQGRLGGAAG